MIKIYNLNEIDLKDILKREEGQGPDVSETVKRIMDNVRENGDVALRAYAKEFDGADIGDILVSKDEIEEAVKNTDPSFLNTLNAAKDNIYAFHKNQLQTGFEIKEKGKILGQRVLPLQRVGVYVPGGTASYPSSVLMNVIPAKIAGVDEIIMTTPPNGSGRIAKEILAAAYVAGVDTIVKSGGAQAVAALAYGTESVRRVDKIVGPGNIFVATAKRMVYGVVDIDMIAGPSEILVVADGTANPVFVAADMLSQAEHDKNAAAILVTTSAELAYATAKEIDRQIQTLSRYDIANISIENNGKIIICGSIAQALETANAIAPEHLEICTEEPFKYLGKVYHAGSVFLGNYSPEALGDYFAGPNHVLPTSGTARFSSPLSVNDFVKRSSYIYYERDELKKASAMIDDFARREGLDGHAKSVMIRFGEKDE